MRQLRANAIAAVAAAFAGLLLLAACSSPSGIAGSDSSRSVQPHFVANVDGPFAIRDPEGRPYQHPFLGGFNVPRPQLIDIDSDGDLDLFVQEEPNAVMLFENVGGDGSAAFVFRTAKFGDLDVGEWFRFADLDRDGRLDLLAEQPYSYMRFLRNTGVGGTTSFKEVADSLKDVEGSPIFSDRQNIPNVTDIDCDGNPDLFIGRLEGTVTRYEWANAIGGVPRFRFEGDRFQGIEIIGQVLGSRHGANTLAFTDIDGDGDQDLLWGDYFEPGLLLIENRGSCDQVSMDSQPSPFPDGDPVRTSGYNAPAPGDIDGDGDVDLVMGVLGGAFNANTTTADNLYFIEQIAPGEFAVRTRRFINTVDVGAESIAAIGDLDGDGDPDLLLSNQIEPFDNQTSGMYFFEMRGDASNRYWQLSDTLHLAQAYHYAPALGDLDGDGDLDMLLGTWRNKLSWYRNVTSGGRLQFEEVPGVAAQLSRGSNATPALVDIDADGDLDLFVGETSGTINFFRNDGTRVEPVFVEVSDEFGSIDVGRRSFPVFEDLDADGDFDLLVGTDSGELKVFRNDGTGAAAVFVEVDRSSVDHLMRAVIQLKLPAFSTPVFIDLDGDGDRDVVSGGRGGGVVYRERR